MARFILLGAMVQHFVIILNSKNISHWARANTAAAIIRVATLWPGQNSLPFPNLFLTHAPIFPTNEMHSAIFSIQSMIECSMTCIHVSTFCVRGFLNLTPCWEGSTYECHKYACLVSSQWLQGNIDADGTPCFFFQKYFTSINTKMI